MPTPANRRASKITEASGRRRLLGISTSTPAIRADNASSNGYWLRGRCAAHAASAPAPVLTATEMDEAEEPFNVTVVGETEHVERAGAPVQVRLTLWLNPPPGDTAN